MARGQLKNSFKALSWAEVEKDQISGQIFKQIEKKVPNDLRQSINSRFARTPTAFMLSSSSAPCSSC